MKLLIDIGNTSAKLAVADHENIIHTEHRTTPWKEALESLNSRYAISRCVVSSVAGDDPTLLAALQGQDYPTLLLGIDLPTTAEGKSPESKLSNCKLSNCQIKPVPPGYGADRLAADLGALTQSPGHTLLVIDAGTCITYDLISREGEIIAGVISPGVQLRLRAMHEHTALLPLFEAETEAPLMGTDTKTSMMSSAIHGTHFELEGYIRRTLALYPDLRVFLTGGNTFPIPTDLRSICTHDPHLLFRGLLAIADL